MASLIFTWRSEYTGIRTCVRPDGGSLRSTGHTDRQFTGSFLTVTMRDISGPPSTSFATLLWQLLLGVHHLTLTGLRARSFQKIAVARLDHW